jgi:predicted MPP superfamily phosphohydrolase
MALPFWLAAALFHAALIGASTVVVTRRLRQAEELPTRSQLPLLGLDGALLGLTATGLAGAASLTVSPASGFTAIRLLSQALFGEGVLLPAIVGFVLLRRRPAAVRAGQALLALAGILLAVYFEAYHREPTDLQLRRYEIDAARGVPHGRLRLVHLSDIQTHHVRAYEERALRQALALKPDMIVMTGDYVQPRAGTSRAGARAELNALLRRLCFDAPLGAFAVRGDVDRDWPAVFAGTPVWALGPEAVRRELPGGRHVSLVGLTPGMSHGRSAEATWGLVESTPVEDLRLVIGHGPDFVLPLAGTTRVDLALAGHTHGGQVALPVFGALHTKTRLPRRYARGLHDYRGIPLEVSAGVGMERGTAPQLRFLCPPEISLLEVRY